MLDYVEDVAQRKTNPALASCNLVAMAEPDRPASYDLATQMEEIRHIRQKFLHQKKLLSWRSPDAVGVKSIKAMALNHKVLEEMARWWCPQWDYVKPYSVYIARSQVGETCPSTTSKFSTTIKGLLYGML